MKIIVYTDLDATLLDADTYAWEPARPALEALRKRESAIVLVSSKTLSEMLPLHRELALRDPFVVENGGGIVMDGTSHAASFFRRQGLPLDPLESGDLVVLPLGARYETLTRALSEIGAEVGCELRGFASMSDAEAAQLTGLPLEDARNARRRDFDEPFLIVGREGGREASICEAAKRRRLLVVSGGRFLHLIGHDGKGRAASLFTAAYRDLYGDILTIGLGDSPNDYPFLELVDIPVLVGVSHDRPTAPATLESVRMYSAPGPHGWNTAVVGALAEIDER